MPKYQFKREPLTQDEARRLANACQTHWSDSLSGRFSIPGFASRSSPVSPRATSIGKGGPFGPKSNRRIVPMSDRIRPLIEAHLGLYGTLGVGVRTIQHMVRNVANRAKIPRKVTPHVGRHTHAVTALQRGISLASLQRVLGHTISKPRRSI